MLLQQISDNGPVSQLALQGLMTNAPILKDAQWYSKAGAADSVKHQRQAAAKTKITRSVNEDNTATPPTNTYNAATKKIVSFDAKVDVFLEDRNEDIFTELGVQTRLEAEEAGWELQEMFFEGDEGSDPEDFDGMRQLTPSAQKKVVATNGLQMPLGNSDANVTAQQTAIEKFLQHAALVQGMATHVYVPEFFKIRLLTVAKNLGFYRQSKDELGNLVEYINDIVIRGAGYKRDGTLLLPFDETVGTSSDCSSLFFVRWGERKFLTMLTSVGVKGRYAGQIGNFIINNVNLDAVMHLQNDKAIMQSQGWRL